MTKPRTVYVDMDDVLCETCLGLTQLLKAEFGRSVAYEDVQDFDLGKSFGLTPGELEVFMRRAHQPEVLAGLAPVTGARETLSAWSSREVEIAIMTGRPPSTRACTREWLDKHGIPFDSLRFVDKYGRFGAEADAEGSLTLSDLASMRFELAVEDSATTAVFLAENGVAPVVLFDRPWNRHETHPAIKRLTGWADLAGWPQ